MALPWIGRSRRRARADGLPASPKPTSRRILTLAAGGVVAIGCVIAAVWLAILYMPLPASQVIPRVKSAIQARLGSDYVVDIADAEIHRGDGVELRLVNLSIAKANGGPVVASVPRAELRLNGLGLLGGDVQVRSVHVTSPRLAMTFDTTVDAASKQSDLPARVLAAVQDLDRLLGADGAAGALEEVEVTGATVRVAPSSRQPLSFDDVDLRLSRGGGGAIALTASSAKSDDRWTTAITVSAVGEDKSRVIDLGVENLNLAPYSAPFAEKAGAPPVTGRISGHVNAKIGADGTLMAGDGRVEARALDFTMPGAPEPGAAPVSQQLSIDRVQLDMRWDAPAHALRISQSQFRSRGGQFNFTGAFVAPTEPGKPWTATLGGTDVLLSGESAGDPPLRLDRIDVEATFDPTAGVLEISKAQALGPTAKASVSGLVRFEGASPAVRLGLVTSPMPASAVKRLWPFFLAKAARGWVVENVGAGQVDQVTLTIDLPSGAIAALKPHEPFPVGSVALEVVFHDGVLRGKAGMPWIEGAVGKVEATSRTVVTTIDNAYVSGASDDGPLAVSNIRFEIPNLVPRYPPAEVSLKADGSLRRALSMLQSGSFGSNPVPSQLDVSKVTGHISSDIKVGLELNHDHDSPSPIVNATADMKDVKIAGIFAGRSFEKGTLQLKVGDGLATLTGKGVVGTAPATVTVSDEPGQASGTFKRKLQATLTADAGDLTKLGLDVPGTLKGAVPLTAELPLDQPGAPMTVKADLVNVGIDGLVPGFSKPSGRPGKLGFIVDRQADHTVIRDFALDSGDRSVRGTIEFGAKGELVSASMPIYRPGPGDDAKIDIDKGKGGITKIAVQGASLDLKPLVDKVRGKQTGAARVQAASAKSDSSIPKNLDITAKLGTGLGYGGEAVAGLDLKLAVRDGKVTDADGSGRIGGGEIKLATGDSGRISLSGGDAGSFFRFADLYGRIDGGGFLLNASLADGPGELKIRDFAIRNETALDRARRATNADKGVQQPDRSGATRFSRLRVTFVRQNGAIEVKDAVVYGPTLGAQLAGTVNYTGDKVDLVGTFVPIYALNNLFGRLPVIGEILGGGQNGGLFGVTFSVRGPTTSPTVTVNPLSLVAPGFFRKIFEFRQNGAAAGGAEPPPPQQPVAPATQQ